MFNVDIITQTKDAKIGFFKRKGFNFEPYRKCLKFFLTKNSDDINEFEEWVCLVISIWFRNAGQDKNYARK